MSEWRGLGHNGGSNTSFPYYCLICGEGYQLHLALLRHRQNKHGAARPTYADVKDQESTTPVTTTASERPDDTLEAVENVKEKGDSSS